MLELRDAAHGDEQELQSWFGHYADSQQRDQRVHCFLECNHTLIAKNAEQIVGVLQWAVVADVGCGVVEISEVFVRDDYRRKHIGSDLVRLCVSNGLFRQA